MPALAVCGWIEDFSKIWPGYGGTGSLWLNRGLLWNMACLLWYWQIINEQRTFLKYGLVIVVLAVYQWTEDFPEIWPGYGGTCSLSINRGLSWNIAWLLWYWQIINEQRTFLKYGLVTVVLTVYQWTEDFPEIRLYDGLWQWKGENCH